jgi:serine/threonine protein phosphatase PrpC
MVKAKLKSAGDSNPGRVRTNNEDAWHIDADRGIFLVVDGIGGQAAGERAAAIAVERLRARLERQTGTTEQRIREAITMANNEILRAARGNPQWEGMACVLTVVVLENGSAVVGHVGDSRLYHIQPGRIRKVTHDHSPVGEREDSQELTEAEAMRHPRRNEVYRDVGSEEHAPEDPDFIEVRRFTFDPDQALVLCSDGLSDQVASADIRGAVERHAGNPEAAVRELIEAANRAGGKDNVTVVVVVGDQFAPPVAAHAAVPQNSRSGIRWWWAAVAFLLGMVSMFGAMTWWESRRVVPAPEALSPRVLMVGPGQAFGNIADALTQARPGDTVEVLAGEYREQVRLKSGVTLRSQVPRQAVLMPLPLSDGPIVLADAVKAARMAGFLVRADRDPPLSAAIVLKDSDVEVSNTEVTGAAIGVEIRGGGGPALVGNYIHDCAGAGVMIAGPSTAWVMHNAIRRNKGAGLEAREGAKPAVMGNVFERNPVKLPPEIPVATVRGQNVFLEAPRPRP